MWNWNWCWRPSGVQGEEVSKIYNMMAPADKSQAGHLYWVVFTAKVVKTCLFSHCFSKTDSVSLMRTFTCSIWNLVLVENHWSNNKHEFGPGSLHVAIFYSYDNYVFVFAHVTQIKYHYYYYYCPLFVCVSLFRFLSF